MLSGALLCWMLLCFMLTPGQCQTVRLVPGPHEGRLEILFEGEWGTLCQSSLTNQMATVLCRSLNQPKKNAYAVRGQTFGAGNLNQRLKSVGCSGEESSLFNCTLTPSDVPVMTCSISYVVGLVCTDEKVQASIKYGNLWFESTRLIDVYIDHKLYCYPGRDDIWRRFTLNFGIGTYRISGTGYRDLKMEKTMSGPLTCSVSNWQWPYQSNITVDVNVIYPPEDLVYSEVKVLEDSAVNVSLRNIPNPLPTQTKWRRAGTKRTWTQNEMFLVYDKISRHDRAEYLVNISWQGNTSLGDFYTKTGLEIMLVDVLYKPTIQCEAMYKFPEGSKVNITCDVDANPPPLTYIWAKKGGDIVSQGSEPGLVFEAVKPDNAGDYTLTVVNSMENSEGEVKSGVSVEQVTVKLGSTGTDPGTPTSTDSIESTTSSPEISPVVTYVVICVAVISLVLVVVLTIIVLRQRRKREAADPDMQVGSPPTGTEVRESGVYVNPIDDEAADPDMQVGSPPRGTEVRESGVYVNPIADVPHYCTLR